MEKANCRFNYVKKVSKTYTPVVYKNNETLNEYLNQKLIINQSNHQLSETEIEFLALGVDFKFKLPEHEVLEKAANVLRNKNTFYIMRSAADDVTVLWSIVDYEKEAYRTLCDEETYEKHWYEEIVSENQRDRNMSDEEKSFESWCFYDSIMYTLLKKRSEFVKLLEERGYIDFETSKIIQMKDKETMKLPNVSFLPDVTKRLHPKTGTFQSTAIVNAEDGPLYPIENYLANVSDPMMYWIPGLSNSRTQLIDEIQSKMDNCKERSAAAAASSTTTTTKTCCEDGHSSQYLGLSVANAETFFPSIDVKHGIEATCNVYQRNYGRLRKMNLHKHLLPPVDPATFRNMLQFIFDNIFMTFDKKSIFRQTNGVPTGYRISVFVAQCFMYSTTNRIIDYPPKWLLVFQRFLGEFFFLICHHPHHGKHLLPDLLKNIPDGGRIKYKLDNNDMVRKNILGPKEIKKRLNRMPRIKRHCIIFNVCISFDPDKFSFKSCPYVKPLEPHHHRESNDQTPHFKELILSHCRGLKSMCSSNRFFVIAKKAVWKQFENRGYSRKECYRIFKEIDGLENLSAFSRNVNTPAQSLQR